MKSQPGICYIVGAMPLGSTPPPSPAEGDLLIAADRGYATLSGLGLTPHVVIGDFDSLGHVPEHPNLMKLPCEKDDTDMGFALNYGLKLGYTRFLLLGGLGGRLDHTMANLQLLNTLSNRGAIGILAGEGQAATVITNGSFSFSPTCSGYCSVYCVSGQAHGVTLEGLKYSLQDASLTGDYPIGTSNEFLGIPAKVSVRRGSLLLIWQTGDPLSHLSKQTNFPCTSSRSVVY